jgi:predicted SprT family Zn-dependent metalloprotease
MKSERLGIIERVFDRVNRKYFHGEVERPVFKLSNRMKRRAGQVNLSRWEMTISVPYHDRYGWDGELENTTKHEIIHLFLRQTRKPSGHNRLFKEIANRIDAPYYSREMPQTSFRYLFECPNCKREYKVRKWIGGRYSCGKCSNGRFDKRYILVIRETLR